MRNLNLRLFDDVGEGHSAVLRNLIADYMEVNSKYELLGIGFTKLDENPGAQSDSTTYINQKGAFYSIDRYDTVFPFEAHMVPAEPGVMEIYNIGRNHATGDAAVRKYCRVELFNPIGVPDDTKAEYKARLFEVAVEVSGTAGNGGEKISVSGNLNARGDFIDGKFDTITGEFTPGSFQGKFDQPKEPQAEG